MTPIPLDSCLWALNGTLISPRGQIPNYLRTGVANTEEVIGGSLTSRTVGEHRPRFGAQGSLLLERRGNNLVKKPLDLTDPVWVKGSSIQILKDLSLGMSDNYQADRITVSATSGNDAAQTLSQEVRVYRNLAYTCTVYLKLVDGQFGAEDVLRVTGPGVLATNASTPLSVLNNRMNLWIPISVTVLTINDLTGTQQRVDPSEEPKIKLEFVCNRTVSVDWGGAQIEEGLERTSFIEGGIESLGRDQDSLMYAQNPIAGLTSWTVYCSLEEWRGDGAICSWGDLQLAIVNGNLQVRYGSNTLPVLSIGPQPKIAVTGFGGQNRIAVFVDGLLRATADLQGYLPNQGSTVVGGDGLRWYRCAYAFDRSLNDGGAITLNQPVSNQLGTLFERDILFLLPPSDPTVINFPAARIRGRAGKTIFKLPVIKQAGQTITARTFGSGSPQSVVVAVNTIVNNAAAQTDWIRINNTIFRVTSDPTPTASEIATLLAGAINASPSAEPVTASASAANITITGANGDPFLVDVSENLRITTLTESSSGNHTVTVPNPTDYAQGRCYFLRNSSFVADAVITNINTATGVITLRAAQFSQYKQVAVGDELVQPRWETLIGPGNYLVTGAEQYPFIEVDSKQLDRFTVANCDWADCTVNFSIRIGL